MATTIAMRLRWAKRGAHVWCRLFTGRPGTFALCGTLTFSESEWSTVSAAFVRAGVEVIEDE